MSKHTPGPWSLMENPEYPSLISIEMSDRKEVGYIAAKSEPNEVANARLIASAPELLEALKRAREALGPSPWGSLRHEIDALIAKVEGKS